MRQFPAPLDTSVISLPPEYLHLAEALAHNDHCRWGNTLLNLGWQYGPQFDPVRQTHPHLLPFHALPEEVKSGKLKIFLENLKALLVLGYRLDSQDAGAESLEPGASAKATESFQLPQLPGENSPANVRLASLIALRNELINLQPNTPDLHSSLGDMLLQQGQPILAYDVLMAGLNRWPDHLRLQQLLALALARSGSTLAANRLLAERVKAGQEDEQTLGLFASTHKDLWKQATDPQTRHRHLQQASQYYLKAYQRNRGIWTGINAATLAVMQGDSDLAQALAAEVRQKSLQDLDRKVSQGEDTYWVLATLGEAELILNHWDAAADYYTRATQVGQTRYGDLSSSYRNAALLMGHFHRDLATLNQWFTLPKVAVFCGHRVDDPARAIPRFPQQMEGAVYEAIHTRLKTLGTYVGFASAASGCDILFLEALLELGGEFNIVLPYNRDQFVKDAVQDGDQGNWMNRFDRVLSHAQEVIIASDYKPKDDAISYEYSNRLLHGLASIRAKQLQTELVPLAVWDRQPGDGHGGTAHTVSYWRNWNSHVEIIDLEPLLLQHCPDLAAQRQERLWGVASPMKAGVEGVDQHRHICALLFADVVHFTDLREDQVFAFSQQFLGAIASLSAQSQAPPLMKNTWGDALYYVFATVEQAGLFALDLCELMQSTDWESVGLPADMDLRIALHAGPVYRNVDPITGQVNYIGNHVNHAARIEPITPPGRVYASQAFAAMAASEAVQTFTCDYVGQVPWAKHYGTFPTYHVHRA